MKCVHEFIWLETFHLRIAPQADERSFASTLVCAFTSSLTENTCKSIAITLLDTYLGVFYMANSTLFRKSSTIPRLELLNSGSRDRIFAMTVDYQSYLRLPANQPVRVLQSEAKLPGA